MYTTLAHRIFCAQQSGTQLAWPILAAHQQASYSTDYGGGSMQWQQWKAFYHNIQFALASHSANKGPCEA